jgi:hypothetical protein
MATSPGEGVSVKTIKLKVLYTFDTEQKDNHLARWAQSIEVQTAYIDDTNQIGIVDLRTCLEAVVNASPELTSQSDNDYTVYAYDYSEPDTPLVGQGMLSKALADQDVDSDMDNATMVTGRITKNIMGLFSRNAQETLEVKLRLTPVNMFGQTRFRSGSMSSQDGRRPTLIPSSSSSNLTRGGSPVDTTGLETVQRMLTGENVGPGSRPGTPVESQGFNGSMRQAGNMSRPTSRAGMRQPTHGRRDSFNSGYYSGDETIEEGPSRKRARITKVEVATKSNFNIERQPESLRVAASTASSVRLHRPVPINPMAAIQAGEEPVRPPTPVPATKTGKPRGRPRKNPPSKIGRGSRARDSSAAPEPAPQPQLLNIPIASPEDTRAHSVDSTPANIPSSPPVMPDMPHQAITSPALPPMIDFGNDSGFMSGNLEDMFADDRLLQFEDFIVDKPEDFETDQHITQSVEQFPPVFDDVDDLDEPQHSKYKTMPPPVAAASKTLSRAQSYTPATVHRARMSSPQLAPAPVPRARQIQDEQREQLRKLAPTPMSDPPPRILQRSQTWAPDSDALMSDAVNGESSSRPKRVSGKKVGKELTRARLENAIAKGEMPPFCDNCGAIETPAWRRAFVKVFEQGWDDVETSLGYGECCFKEPIDHYEDGSVKKFRGYKVEKKAGDEDDEWESVTLCNREYDEDQFLTHTDISSLRSVVSQTEVSPTSLKMAKERPQRQAQTEAESTEEERWRRQP